MNRRHVLGALLVLTNLTAVASQQPSRRDREWKTQAATLKATPEAASSLESVMWTIWVSVGRKSSIRFAASITAQTSDPLPLGRERHRRARIDRMMVSSKFNAKTTERTCGSDGYASSQSPPPTAPVPYTLPIDALKGATITNAYVQLFIDDLAPNFCSKFQLTLNGTRFVEGERVLNAIDQTGPVGKLITLKVPEEFYPVLSAGGKLEVRLDDVNGAADGFAIDFIRLLINRNRDVVCKGDQAGRVQDKETGAPIPGARVSASDVAAVTTDADGYFS